MRAFECKIYENEGDTADLQGVDGYLTLMADKLDVPVQRLTNNNSIRHVRSLVRDRYRESAHGTKKMGLWGKCLQSLAAHPPERSDVTTTLCCHKGVFFSRFFFSKSKNAITCADIGSKHNDKIKP